MAEVIINIEGTFFRENKKEGVVAYERENSHTEKRDGEGL